MSRIPDSTYDHCSQALVQRYGENHARREEYIDFTNVILENLGLRLLAKHGRGFQFIKPQGPNHDSRARIRRLAGAHREANQRRRANANPTAAAANANAGNADPNANANAGNEEIDPPAPVINPLPGLICLNL